MSIFKCPNCNTWFEEQDCNIATMSQGYIKDIPKEERCSCKNCGHDVEEVKVLDESEVIELLNEVKA